MSWDYGVLATEVYDLDKPVGGSFADVRYYERLLDGLAGRVLEPAVGTGRVLIPLLEAGFEVTGYDSSPEMLAVCRTHCRERGLDPRLSEADMTSFIEPGAYAAVIIPAGTLTLLDGRDALLKALGCFRESLQPSGRLTFDIGAPQREDEPDAMRSWRSHPFIWTLQTMHVEHDPSTNRTTSWLRYEKWQDGALIATELQLLRLQQWTIPELEALLREAGFTSVRVTADHQDDNTPGPDSAIWTFQAATA